VRRDSSSWMVLISISSSLACVHNIIFGGPEFVVCGRLFALELDST
jgi:hypothetical protein